MRLPKINPDKGIGYFFSAIYFLWTERPIQSLSSFSLGTGWVYALLKKDLDRPYIAFEWIPWPMAAITAVILGWGWLLGTMYVGEKATRHFVWAQALIWVMVASHFDPIVQITGFVTYSLLAGALLAQTWRTQVILKNY